MKKVFSAVLVFAALCLIVAVWTLKDFNNTARSEIIARVSEKTGRSLSIDGDIKVHYSLSPSIEINDIRLSNASWAENPYMARIGKAELQIKLLPLFSRKVDVRLLTVKDANIVFEINQNGAENWAFVKNKEKGAQQKPEKKGKTFFLKQINRAVFENIGISLNNRQKNRKITTKIQKMTAAQNKEDFSFESQWLVEKNKFNVSLKGDALPVLLNQQNPYHFVIKMTGDGSELNAEGNIDKPLSDMRIKAETALHLANASVFNKIIGYSIPSIRDTFVKAKIDLGPDGFAVPDFEIKAGSSDTVSVQVQGAADSFSPFSLRARTEIKAENMGKVPGLPALPVSIFSGNIRLNDGIFINDLKMKVGQSDLSGNIEIRTAPKVLVQIKLLSNRFVLSDFLGKSYQPVQGKNRSVSLSPQAKKRVFSSEPFPFEKLKEAKIDIDVLFNDLLGADNTRIGPFHVAAAMHDGIFDLPTQRLANYAVMQARFDASKQPAEIQAGFKMNKLPLSLFFAQNKVERGEMTGTLHLSGYGNSESEMAASLNGQIFINTRDVYISSFRFHSLPKILEFLSPVDEKQALAIPCFVVNIPVKNGFISSRKKIGMENNLFDMQINGDVDLSKEAIDLKMDFSPRSSGVLKSVFNSVFVKGTLAYPKISFNTDQAIDKALSIGMAFFMGGKQAAQEMIKQPSLKNVCADAMAAQ